MMGSLNATFWALGGLGAAAAVIYGLFSLRARESLGRAALKTLFMMALAAAFQSAGAPWIVLLAFAAAAVGDFVLAFENKAILPLGILAFLICQLAYLYFFWTHRASAMDPAFLRYAAMALVLATAIGFLIWMGPKLGTMTVPVIVYSVAICAMACSAFLLPWRAWPAMAGVVSFLTSDFVLSAELFRLAPDAPARRITVPVVWWTYVAAQLLIAWGIVRALQEQG
ncbi:MAG: lysoplasmalogenase [Proteobacteria bacterium]|nr:lysoplasmalogenase [Pseudomonadota bacterium]